MIRPATGTPRPHRYTWTVHYDFVADSVNTLRLSDSIRAASIGDLQAELAEGHGVDPERISITAAIRL